MKKEAYSIKDLEVLSGIKAHTIRIWEKRYELLSPARTNTNIRYYDDNHLRKILNVSMLVRNGYKISKVASWGEKKVKETVLNLSDKTNSENEIIDRLLLHMINFDNESFNKLTGEIIMLLGVEEAVTKIFFEFLVRIGTYWQVGSIFPAQEHYVTNIFRQKLIVEIDKLDTPKKSETTILFFLHGNELHELSLLYYYYLAVKLGYDVIYLGQDVPFEDLQVIQEKKRIDFVFTAFINSIEKDELEQYLIDLKALFNKQKIFVTGWQLQVHNPELPRNVKIVKDYKDFKKYSQ